MNKNKLEIIPTERIHSKIFLARGQKIIIDEDLAEFYGVETKKLVQAVKRNIERFPADFILQLTDIEYQNIKSINFAQHGGRRYNPYAFTEQGVAMLSAILKSKRAVTVSVQIMRSFVRLRELLNSNEQLAKKLKTLEARTDEHSKAIVQIINELQKPIPQKKRRIGF